MPLSGVAYVEQAVAEVAEQAVHLEVEVGDDQVEPPVAVVVAGIGAHAGARLAVGGHRHTRPQRRPPRSASVPVLWNRKFGTLSLATNTSGQPSSS